MRKAGAWTGAGLRLLPDLVRLCARMGRDGSVPRRARLALLLALAYNVQPINLIPDFVPLVGLSDNFVVTFLAVRYAIRCTGADVAQRHWPGTSAGYTTMCRLLLIRQAVSWTSPPLSVTAASAAPDGQS